MHDAGVMRTRITLALRLIAMGTLAYFLATGFRAGWQRDETDFPNYYTAAVLVRKGAPLRKFYDWTWFAREMGKAGLGTRVGAYTPQTPLTMLPMIGLARFSLQRAKQVWLVCNLFFLAGTLWMLSRVTRRPPEHLWLFMFCGYSALYANFLLGQYYVFLLFLLTLTLYLLHRGQTATAGLVTGATFALKLYGGPYLVYFVATRRWKAAAAATIAIVAAAGLAVWLFGWPDVQYYALQILPRSLEGGAVDPFNVRNQTMPTLLGVLLLREPLLNPNPLWNAPAVYFFLRAFFSIAVVLLAYLGVGGESDVWSDFGWFVIAALLMSTNISSYTFVIILLPFVLLLDRNRPLRSAYLALSCAALTFPLHLAKLFPKLWLLLALFVVFGWARWRKLPAKTLALAATMVVAASGLSAWRQMRSYEDEPGRHAEQMSVSETSLFSSYPAVTAAGIFFQSMDADQYVVRWQHGDQVEEIRLDGNAFQPMPLSDGSIAIEQAENGVSTMVRFDPATRKLIPTDDPVPTNERTSATSPDGKWLAYTTEERGGQHLWLRNMASGHSVQLGGGNCDSSWPAWELDSQALVFASDCGRAVGLPALYRARVPEHIGH